MIAKGVWAIVPWFALLLIAGVTGMIAEIELRFARELRRFGPVRLAITPWPAVRGRPIRGRIHYPRGMRAGRRGQLRLECRREWTERKQRRDGKPVQVTRSRRARKAELKTRATTEAAGVAFPFELELPADVPASDEPGPIMETGYEYYVWKLELRVGRGRLWGGSRAFSVVVD